MKLMPRHVSPANPFTLGEYRDGLKPLGEEYNMEFKNSFSHPEDVSKANLSGGLEGKRIIVQGLGNVGYHAAKFLEEEDGALIHGIIERDGAIICDQGLHTEDVYQFKPNTENPEGFPEGTFIKNGNDALELPCDILIPMGNGRGDINCER